MSSSTSATGLRCCTHTFPSTHGTKLQTATHSILTSMGHDAWNGPARLGKCHSATISLCVTVSDSALVCIRLSADVPTVLEREASNIALSVLYDYSKQSREMMSYRVRRPHDSPTQSPQHGTRADTSMDDPSGPDCSRRIIAPLEAEWNPSRSHTGNSATGPQASICVCVSSVFPNGGASNPTLGSNSDSVTQILCRPGSSPVQS